jgi:hypothetical protein
MVKKHLRTVKKSSQTGRLSRAAVRLAVIAVRDGHRAQVRTSESSRRAMEPLRQIFPALPG